MVNVAVVGLGKMGISHLSILNAQKRAKVVAVCDSSAYILSLLNKYTGMAVYTDVDTMLNEQKIDALVIATPSILHADMVRKAMGRGISVFCEKPFCLKADDSDELVRLASSTGLVNQVGYHYRFVGAFQELKRVIDSGALGRVSHVLAEAYGPVVLKAKGSTWRTQRVEGGGCLYDYAAHPINLLNWYFGAPEGVGGAALNSIFSNDTDDEVFGTLFFPGNVGAQLSVNWSDESYRKMSTKISVWGSNGRAYADRQECQVYLRKPNEALPGYDEGWTVKYTTELTAPVDFYLRGEEYSAQIDYFIDSVAERRRENVNSFESAAETDRVIEMIIADAQGEASATPVRRGLEALGQPSKRSLFSRLTRSATS